MISAPPLSPSNIGTRVQPFAPRRSRVRQLLLGALVVVWFSEMVLWGFRPLSEVWGPTVWGVSLPEDPQLATALYITRAINAAAKGALGVLAVFALRSSNTFARTALFASMALVPPFNLAFQFREQGFPLRPTAIATLLSIILWGAFFLFKEPTQQPAQRGTERSGQLPPSRWEIFQYVWFGANAIALTLMAFLFLFWPGTALNVTMPYLSGSLNTHDEVISSLIISNLGIGTHLLALATATWIATLYCRSNPTLRHAVMVASPVQAALICLLPLRQIFLEAGATSSILVAFVPLLVGWVLYAALSYRMVRGVPSYRAAADRTMA